MNANFKTVFTFTHTNAWNNTYKTSLICQSAGLVSRGSASVHSEEMWLVRVQRVGDVTFHGARYAATDKLKALADYAARKAAAATA